MLAIVRPYSPRARELDWKIIAEVREENISLIGSVPSCVLAMKEVTLSSDPVLNSIDSKRW